MEFFPIESGLALDFGFSNTADMALILKNFYTFHLGLLEPSYLKSSYLAPCGHAVRGSNHMEK